MTHPIEHNAASSRFETTVDGLTAIADYRLSGSVMEMTHTEVPPQLKGRGIASKLVQAAVAHARANGLRIAPHCSYVADWMARHPETADLRA